MPYEYACLFMYYVFRIGQWRRLNICLKGFSGIFRPVKAKKIKMHATKCVNLTAKYWVQSKLLESEISTNWLFIKGLKMDFQHRLLK